MPEKDMSVYTDDRKTADERGELDKWRDSRKENRECAAAIDKAINDNYLYENYHLDTDNAIKSVTERFGSERMGLLLAAHIVNHDWDGRYSKEVKDWAKEKTTKYSESFLSECKSYNLNAHPTLIDGVARGVVKLEKELNKQKEAEKPPEKPKFVDQKERVKSITDKLEAGIKELFSSEKFKAYLDTMSKFHNYSFNNTMLIAMQKPDATLVAGFNSWKSNFSRNVNKGEKGIQILAPAPYKIKKEEVKLDPITDLPVLDKDGKPVVEEKEVTIPAFKVVSVFDVSQTNGKELPTLGADELHGDVKNFEKFFVALKEVSPVPIKFEKIEDGAKGFYHQENKDITINEGMSEIQTIKTAIHEIAHAKLHDKDDSKANSENKKDSSTKEVEAESIAYTVCQHFGIDTSDYSFGYVAAWGSGKDLPELKNSLETIRNTASELITAIEQKYLGIEKDKTQEHTTEMPSKSKNIIGNTKYADIQDKQYFRHDSKTAELIAAKLTENNIPFSGRIGSKNTTLTIGKADVEKYKAIADEISGAEKKQPEQESKWRFYVIPDLKTWADNGKTAPKTPIEYFDTIDTAKARFDELRNQPYNSEKVVLNGLPAARLTLGIDSEKANAAFDIIHVRDNKNVLVDDFTRNSKFSEDKEGLAALNQIADKIGFDTVMLYTKQENGRYNEMPEMIPFKDWENPYFNEKPQKEQLNIIGNTAYKDIPEKTYAKLSTEKAREVADVLETKGMKFSGRIDGDKTTLTFSKSDMPIYKEALAELKKAHEVGTSSLEMQLDKAETERQKQPEYDGKLPDSTISIEDRNSYGYTDNIMLPLSTEKALEYFDNDTFAVYLLYPDGTEGQANERSDIETHNGIFGIETPDWEKYQAYQEHLENIATQEPAREAMLMNDKNCMAGIYQLKDIPENRDLRFMGMDYLNKKQIEPERDNYSLVYTFEVLPEDLQDKAAFLENVFQKYNIDRPSDFTGHSLSVSDIVVIQNNGEMSAHFVDRTGFCQLENFGKVRENPLKAIEDSIEQNDNNFDGIINNMPDKTEKDKPAEKRSILSYLREAKNPPEKPERDEKTKAKSKGAEL